MDNRYLIGGLAVVGLGLFIWDKKQKADAQKTDAQELAQQQLPTTQNTTDTKAVLTPKEATVYVLKTIADVNSLLEKYPLMKKESFLNNWNKRNRTNLTLDSNNNFVDLNSKPNGTVVSPILINESEMNIQRANKEYNALNIAYNSWKSNFSTIYSNLKDYFSTLTKEKADIISKYLPKFIVQTFLGDYDPRANQNNFYTQEEVMGMVDNKIDADSVLKSALGDFFSNLRKLAGYGYSDDRIINVQQKLESANQDILALQVQNPNWNQIATSTKVLY
jgi:hypothetical protein